MATDDIVLIDRHLAILRTEIAELRDALEQAASMEREATLQDVFEKLRPAMEIMGSFRGGVARDGAEVVVEAFEAALEALGLSSFAKEGEILELWPEEAEARFILDRGVPPDAALVRVKVLANGWKRGRMVVARGRGHVLELIEGGSDV